MSVTGKHQGSSRCREKVGRMGSPLAFSLDEATVGNGLPQDCTQK